MAAVLQNSTLEPAPYQIPEILRPIVQNPSRYKIIYGGRGSSKSWSVARILLRHGYKSRLRILCGREIQNTIEESVHQLLKEQIDNLGLDWFYTVTDKSIVGLNGTEFLFKGLRSQDIAKVKSLENIDICWIEEGQTLTKKSWKTLIPTIRSEDERDGVLFSSEIWVTFNPDLADDETYVRFVVSPPADSIVVKVNWRDNPWFPKVLEAERQEMMRQVELGNETQAEYDNVWEGICKPSVEGAIYANQIALATEQGRIACNVPYDPLLKVHTVWDLGWGVMAVGIYQRQASEMRIIGYEEYNEMTYAEVIIELEGNGREKYRWATDWLPHDSKSHNPLSKKTPKQMLTSLGRTVEEVPEIGIENGIKAAQQIFGRCYFDKDKAGLLTERLKRYRRRINQTTEAKSTPLADDNAHGSDQFRYMAVIADKMVNEDEVVIDDPYSGFGKTWAG